MLLLIYHLFQPNFLFQIEAVSWMYCLTNLLFFDIALLYYYINLSSSIIHCLSLGYIYIYIYIYIYLLFSVSISFLNSFKLFCKCNSFNDFFVILSAILLPIKSPVGSAVFELLFLRKFLLHLWQIFKHYQEVLDCTYCSCF